MGGYRVDTFSLPTLYNLSILLTDQTPSGKKAGGMGDLPGPKGLPKWFSVMKCVPEKEVGYPQGYLDGGYDFLTRGVKWRGSSLFWLTGRTPSSYGSTGIPQLILIAG